MSSHVRPHSWLNSRGGRKERDGSRVRKGKGGIKEGRKEERRQGGERGREGEGRTERGREAEGGNYWVSMSLPHTSAFNVEFCPYICWTARDSQHGQLSWSLVSHTVTATTCVHLPIAFHLQVCPTVRPCFSNADRWRGKGRLLRLRMKQLLHCAAYVLLPCSCSPHNVLHSASKDKLCWRGCYWTLVIANHN